MPKCSGEDISVSMHSLIFPSKGQYQKTASSADQEKLQDLSTFNYYLQQPSFITEKNLFWRGHFWRQIIIKFWDLGLKVYSIDSNTPRL